MAQQAGTALRVRRPMAGNAHLIDLDSPLGIEEAYQVATRLMSDPAVEYAEPNVRFRHAAVVPNDPLYYEQWHLYEQPGIGSNIAGAWSMTTGDPTTVIAVIDTGLVPHGDIGTYFDGSGRILPGYDFYDNNSDPSDPGDWSSSEQSSWHGTHTTGIINALSDNNKGVTGINWHASTLPVRVLGSSGGYLSDIAEAIYWSAGLSVPGVGNNPHPAQIINLSLQYNASTCPSLLQNAIDAAYQAGSILVSAAGNSSRNARSSSPANCRNTLTVASTNQQGDRSSFSNYGEIVDISAPGSGIYATLNTGAREPVTTPSGDSYGVMSGTSMATPIVSGVISLMLAVNPDMKYYEIVEILSHTAYPFAPGSDCYTRGCGAGIIDGTEAVRAAANPGELESIRLHKWQEALLVEIEQLKSKLPGLHDSITQDIATELREKHDQLLGTTLTVKLLESMEQDLQFIRIEIDRLQDELERRRTSTTYSLTGKPQPSSSNGGCTPGGSGFADATLPITFSFATLYLLGRARKDK
ncbi:S8 family peptidase [Desulfurispira natronophila]|uniref:Serine protease n=1 Tax=Desulfurispira natronophila TaxID=682562 RepID=A0A7W7Y2J5_9BACT|nr:S8 family peptidase [Desulfurispira natronophila]MBB5020873.1 serine protease [Desulfurispira natronophila]